MDGNGINGDKFGRRTFCSNFVSFNLVYGCYCCLVGEEKFEDTKRVIRSRKSKMDRQYNGHRKMNRTNNDLQNITQKINDRATRTPLNPGVNSETHIVLSRYKPGDKS